MRVKHALDKALAAFLLVLLIPLLIVTATAVFVCMGRPIFFRQTRIGRNYEPFVIWKIRTMDEGQVTRLGRFLRATSVDELPQLINILRGEMSFIGPRPETAEIATLLQPRIDGFIERHQVRPGISGWAQIHGAGRGEDRYADYQRKVLLDLEYVNDWSPLMELKIWFRTPFCIWKHPQVSMAEFDSSSSMCYTPAE